MISSGDSMLDVARQLKQRKAKRIFCAATFGLFTNGLEKFDQAYKEGILDAVLTTNLIYQTPELLERPYYINCDMSKYIALVIDTLNHDGSISSILNPIERIQNVVTNIKTAKKFKILKMLPGNSRQHFYFLSYFISTRYSSIL